MFNLDQSILEWRRQMLAADINSPVPLDELETHLRDEIEQQAKSGVSEAEAFRAAVEKIGQAQTLKSEFDIAVESRKTSLINHNRLYSTILAILALFNANQAINLLRSQISLHKFQSLAGRLPPGLNAASHPWLTAFILAYTVAMAVTFFARRFRPDTGRRLTWLLNWALLPVIPVGTVLGLYGLWKVDKEKAQYVCPQ